MVLNEEDTNEIQFSLDEGLSWVNCTFGVRIYPSEYLFIQSRTLSACKILFPILILEQSIS